MVLDELCERAVVTVRRADSVLEAARRMRDEHVGCVVVVDDADGAQRPVGMLTDRDIVVAVVAFNLDAEEVAVGDVMSTPLQVLPSGAGIEAALERMHAEGVRRLPLVDARGRLVGLVRDRKSVV